MRYICFECDRILKDPIQVNLYWYNKKKFGSTKKADMIYHLHLCSKCFEVLKNKKLEEIEDAQKS